MLIVRAVLVLFIISSAVSFPLKFDNPLLNAVRPARSPKADVNCFTYTCATLGQSCVPNADYTVVPLCTGSFCNDEAMPPVCVALLEDGQNCTSSDQCKPTSYCDQVNGPLENGVCTNSDAQKSAGGKCTNAAGCLYDLPCTNGVCVGGAIGGTCFTSGQCNPPLVCNSGACALPLATGASCDVNNDLCDPRAYCAPTTVDGAATCQAFGSASVGSPCTDSMQCPDGAACTATYPEVLGVCVSVPASSSKTACTNDTTCTLQYETCQCSYATGKSECRLGLSGNPSGSRAGFQAILDCAQANCATDFTEDCYLSKCQSQYCNYINVEYQALFGSMLDYYPQCFVDYVKSYSYNPAVIGCPAPTPAPTSAAASVSSFIGLVSLFVLAIMF